MAGYTPQNRGNKTTNRTGPNVSRKLRAAGWNISPSARKYREKGIFVSAGGNHVWILVDLGDSSKNVDVAKAMTTQLSTWDCVSGGVRWTQPGNGGHCSIRFDYQR